MELIVLFYDVIYYMLCLVNTYSILALEGGNFDQLEVVTSMEGLFKQCVKLLEEAGEDIYVLDIREYIICLNR